MKRAVALGIVLLAAPLGGPHTASGFPCLPTAPSQGRRDQGPQDQDPRDQGARERAPAVARARQEARLPDYEEEPVSAPPAALGLDPFYAKYTEAGGIPVVSSEKVPDAALLVARSIVDSMLAMRPDVRAVMIERGFRVGIMAQSEMQTDLPEYSDWKKPAIDDPRLTSRERDRYNEPGGIGSMTDREYWNRRARGMGGRYTTGAEENVLGYPGTRYYGENILVHEFSHAVMSALRSADPALYREIQDAYREAKAGGLFRGHYAENTAAEYWAEGTQWWFWSNYEWYDGDTRLQTPDDLKAYDPRLYAILERVYPDHDIPADVYHGRNIRPARPRGPRRPLSAANTLLPQ